MKTLATDEEREELIKLTGKEIEAAILRGDRKSAKHHNLVMCELIAHRSPKQIKKMEKERGLV